MFNLLSLDLVNLLTFLAAGMSLAIWTISEGRSRFASLWRKLTFVTIGAHVLTSLTLSQITSKFQSITIDISMLAAVGGLLLILRLSSAPRRVLIMGSILLILLLGMCRGPIMSHFALDCNLAKEDEHFEFLAEIPKEDLADFKRQYKKYIISIEKAFHSNNIKNTDLDEYYLLNVKNSALRDFEIEMPEIKNCDWIEYNEIVDVNPIEAKTNHSPKIQINFNDPLVSQQWALNQINLEDFAKEIAKRSALRKSKLFILDTGIDIEHEDLQDNVIAIDGEKTKDVVGHGTHCAGIAGATINNGIGIASPLVHRRLYDISSIKVLSDFGSGSQATIIQGMIKAVDAGADVLSMSLGGFSNDKRQRAYNQAVEYANKAGAIVVVAAGNSATDARRFAPANADGVICVGAIDIEGQPAAFSNDVSNVAMGIYAPGVNILSTYPGNQYKSFNGTSMAAPLVASLVATLKAFKPNLTTEQVYQLLNVQQFGTEQSSPVGRIDFGKTIRSLN